MCVCVFFFFGAIAGFNCVGVLCEVCWSIRGVFEGTMGLSYHNRIGC